MICDECGVNNATIKLMTIVNGERRERNLCTACMAKLKKNFQAIDLSSLAGLLGGFLQAAQKQGHETEEPALDITCPQCGMTYETFKKTGFLGCAGCYQAFRAPLSAMLTRVHGNTRHTGRVPGGQTGTLSVRLELERLRQQLGRAISEEAYEEAATLRDEIRALKTRLEGLEAGKENAHA